MTEPALMTTEEVAALFRCTPRTLFTWRRLGRLSPRRVGRRWLYRKEEVDALWRWERGVVSVDYSSLDRENDNDI